MSLRDEMALYTELTGEDGTKVPIIALGHFLWGYEIGVNKSRPKGKWETVSREKEACEIFFTNKKCSNCGYEYCFPFYYNYCPECGADMRGKK